MSLEHYEHEVVVAPSLSQGQLRRILEAQQPGDGSDGAAPLTSYPYLWPGRGVSPHMRPRSPGTRRQLRGVYLLGAGSHAVLDLHVAGAGVKHFPSGASVDSTQGKIATPPDSISPGSPLWSVREEVRAWRGHIEGGYVNCDKKTVYDMLRDLERFITAQAAR